MKTHEKKAAETADTPGTSNKEPKTGKKRKQHGNSRDVAEGGQKRVRLQAAEMNRLQREVTFPTFVRPEHEDIYRENWRQIQTQTRMSGQRQRLYNFMLEASSFEELENIFREVHQDQHNQYKVNYSFGFVLRNNTSGAHRYYHASNNTRVLERPMLIQHSNGLNALLSILGDVDVLEYARRQRPNSQWVVELVTNVLVYVYPLHTRPIGTGREPLPSFLKNNPFIITLDKKEKSGALIRDNLCFFRCLALHFGHCVRKLETVTVELFSEYCKAAGIGNSIPKFEGVTLHALRQLEDVFEVNIQVYSMDEKAQATLIRRSLGPFRSTLYLNLHNNHFSYITDFKCYSKAHKCRSCETVFTTTWSCSRHERTCQGKTKFIFPGGVFRPPVSVFAKMEQHAISYTIDPDDQFYPYRATYDIECFMDDKVEKSDTEKLSWIATHRVASISVCGNVPGYTEPKCFVSEGNEKQLVYG
jgi:hypothetical protein